MFGSVLQNNGDEIIFLTSSSLQCEMWLARNETSACNLLMKSVIKTLLFATGSSPLPVTSAVRCCGSGGGCSQFGSVLCNDGFKILLLLVGCRPLQYDLWLSSDENSACSMLMKSVIKKPGPFTSGTSPARNPKFMIAGMLEASSRSSEEYLRCPQRTPWKKAS